MLQIDNNTYSVTIKLDNTNVILTSLKSLSTYLLLSKVLLAHIKQLKKNPQAAAYSLGCCCCC